MANRSSMAKKILAGFFVVCFAVSTFGSTVVLADVSNSSQTPDPVLVVMTVAAMQNEVKAFGRLPVADTARPRRILNVEISAYTSRAEETDSTPFITASGTHVHDGTLATNMLKFGTKVRIPALYGEKIFTVEDRMNARYQNHADVWVENVALARYIGRRHLTIEVF